ncbi:MAG: BamA/TamA family outer membrane protein [Aureispira sp.]|nr:BamA/TamA family outer membrane protein [Aureispira sp.]
MKLLIYIITLLTILGSSTGCLNYTYLKAHSDPEHPRKRVYDEHLVLKNKTYLNKQKYKIQEDKDNLYYELGDIVRQRPNTNILSYRPFLSFYNSFDSVKMRYRYKRKKKKIVGDTLYRKSNKLNNWLAHKIGNRPVIFDSTITIKTAQSMQRALQKRSYHNAKVTYKVKYKGFKTIVSYYATTGMPILIDTVAFSSKDPAVNDILQRTRKKSALKKHQPISEASVNEELRRITLALRNRGYFKFIPNYIKVEGDTINAKKYKARKAKLFKRVEQGEPRANVYIEVLPYSDTLLTHPIYNINNVYITPNEYIIKPHQKRRIKKDTSFIVLRPFRKRKKKYTLSSLSQMEEGDSLVHIILRKKYSKPIIRYRVISDAVVPNAGDLYQYDAAVNSRLKISDLNVFRFPRVDYVPSTSKKPDELDCIIKMRPAKKQEFGVSLETNTDYSNLGVAANINYRNRNIFKGAEILVVNFDVGANFYAKKDSARSSIDEKGLISRINLLDINGDVSLYFPKFIGPRFLQDAFKMENPRTRVSIGYNYLQQSTDFRVSSFYTRFGYEWSTKTYHKFTWNPALINFTLEPILNESFEDRLRTSNRALLESLKAQFLIPSMDFTYTFSTPENTRKNSLFFKAYAEIAGNLLNAFDYINPNDTIRFFGVDYSQYVKVDFDFHYSIYLNRKHSIVTRLMAGVAVPLGNSSERGMPFSKRFFLGGPSSMRAWSMRHLGPGQIRSQDGTEFQLGDVRLEFNMEYRFMFSSWIGGVVFADVGNVWLLKPEGDNSFSFPQAPPPTGVFSSNFVNELAFDAGLGIRLDFSFFIFRLDWAIQLRDPSGYGGPLSDGRTRYWNFDPFVFKGRNQFVLAIGYPF